MKANGDCYEVAGRFALNNYGLQLDAYRIVHGLVNGQGRFGEIKYEEITSFSIVTTDANELMAEIHNTKQRMPLVLSKQAREAWLSDVYYKEFAYPNYDPKLRTKVI